MKGPDPYSCNFPMFQQSYSSFWVECGMISWICSRGPAKNNTYSITVPIDSPNGGFSSRKINNHNKHPGFFLWFLDVFFGDPIIRSPDRSRTLVLPGMSFWDRKNFFKPGPLGRRLDSDLVIWCIVLKVIGVFGDVFGDAMVIYSWYLTR